MVGLDFVVVVGVDVVVVPVTVVLVVVELVEVVLGVVVLVGLVVVSTVVNGGRGAVVVSGGDGVVRAMVIVSPSNNTPKTSATIRWGEHGAMSR